MRRKLLTVAWGRNICGWAWTRHRPDSPRHQESVTLAEVAMTHCETQLTDGGYWLHLLCRAAISPGSRSEGKKKKHLSAFAFFQQHAKNSCAGPEQGEADYTFWLMVPYTFREISYRRLIYLRISSRDGPRAKPWTQTPQAFRKFGRGSEFSPVSCLVPVLPLTVNLLPASIFGSLRPLLNKPSPD